MKIWAIADLHLAFGVPNKNMDVFGPKWHNYTENIKKNWINSISNEDLVLISGDISWAMSLEEAVVDLLWIDALPGTKVILKGNHDYWWTSLTKIKKILPPSVHAIQNNALLFDQVAIAGARLWDNPQFNFDSFIDWGPNPKKKENQQEETEKIYQREIQRLEMSLKELDSKAEIKIALTHYPPVNASMEDSQASLLLEKYHIQKCIFGHLHNVKEGIPLFGNKNGVEYILTACDYLHFNPIQIS